jgi:SAM-dependent methyltransferase
VSLISVPHPRRLAATLAILALAAAAPLKILAAAATTDAAPVAEEPELMVPYVPTAPEIVDKMLEMAKVGKNDLVYDLGCGDGRIVITAAKKYGARGVGVDLNPKRIEEARSNLKEAGPEVAKRVRFITGDLFKVDISKATVVTLYLLPEVNLMLRPKLWKELAVGTRIVSHDYHMGDDWPPEQTVQVEGKVVYSWTIKPEHKKRA